MLKEGQLYHEIQHDAHGRLACALHASNAQGTLPPCSYEQDSQASFTHSEALTLFRLRQAYLLARAIQFWTPGVPMVYYVGLFAGANDYEVHLFWPPCAVHTAESEVQRDACRSELPRITDARA